MTSPFLIDVHAHLEDEKFSEDVRETIERASTAGVKRIINAGCSIPECEAIIKLSELYNECFSIVGVHPHNAKEFVEEDLDKLTKFTKHSKVLGIGEIGLDYFYDFAPKDLQIEVFQKQWVLASKLNLPVELHIRDAYVDFFPAIKELPKPPKVMLHCFSGDIDIARKALDLGFEFSIGGVLTFNKSESTRQIFKFIPDNRIHLETDCPYLAPQGKRGKRNEPAFVAITLEFLAKVKCCSVEHITEILYQNAKSFFGEKLGL
jgi:TatD DNase family protein